MAGWRVVVHRRVIVNLVTGAAIDGVLLRQTGPLLILADCKLRTDQGEWVPADGQIVVERSQIEFVQALGG